MCRFDSCYPYVEDKARSKARNRANADAKRLRIADYKLEKGCTDCGYNENAAALEFDHLPGFDKTKTVGSFCWSSWERIMEEIKKCEVVCANCHAIRSAGRGWHRK